MDHGNFRHLFDIFQYTYKFVIYVLNINFRRDLAKVLVLAILNFRKVESQVVRGFPFQYKQSLLNPLNNLKFTY